MNAVKSRCYMSPCMIFFMNANEQNFIARRKTIIKTCDNAIYTSIYGYKCWLRWNFRKPNLPDSYLDTLMESNLESRYVKYYIGSALFF